MEKHTEYMKTACDLASTSVNRGSGPFGALIVMNNTRQIVGRGHNMVTTAKDPTMHAEIVAIRDACRFLDTFILDDCVLYTSCEPCPMCLSAAYWARIPTIYYANTKIDAKKINFDDAFIYEELQKEPNERFIKMIHLNECSAYAKKAFDEWENKDDKINY
jgi:tRNA(Arg) A34 adenosine deaminase TadA